MCLYIRVLALHTYSMWPGHWMLQSHVLCSSERQSVCTVVADQLRDAREDTAALIQCIPNTLTALSLGHDDMHATLTGPDGTRQRERLYMKHMCVTHIIRKDTDA